jgi:hypothetical protein
MKEKCKKVEYNKKIFLLISFCLGSTHFPPQLFERMSKAGFSADSNTSDTSQKEKAQEEGKYQTI